MQDYLDKPDTYVERDYHTGIPKIFRTVNGTQDELTTAILQSPVSVAV